MEGITTRLEFVSELLNAIELIRQECSRDVTINIERHHSKDYWTVDFKFSYCNSKYSDCVVFYLDEDNFKPGEVFTEMETIHKKWKLLKQ